MPTRFHSAESGPLRYQRKTECSRSLIHSNGYSRQRTGRPITRSSPVRSGTPSALTSSVKSTGASPTDLLKRSVFATSGQSSDGDARRLHVQQRCFLASSRRGRSGGGEVVARGAFVGGRGRMETGACPSAMACRVSNRERADGNRSSFSFARQRATTVSRSGWTAGFFEDGSGATELPIVSRRASVPCPRNGRSPVSISKRMTPMAKTSVRGHTGSPSTCSGAMYPGDPASCPA